MNDQIENAIAMNLVAWAVLVGFGLLIGATKREPLFGAWFGFCLGAGLTFWGWFIYVVAHFVAKFW